MAYYCPHWSQWKNSLLYSVGERPDPKSGLLSTVGSQCQSKQSKFGFFSAPCVFSKLPAKCWVQTLYSSWGERLVRLCQACGVWGFVNLVKYLLALQNVIDFCKPVLLWLQVRAHLFTRTLLFCLDVHVHVHMKAVVELWHPHRGALPRSHNLDQVSSPVRPCLALPPLLACCADCLCCAHESHFAQSLTQWGFPSSCEGLIPINNSTPSGRNASAANEGPSCDEALSWKDGLSHLLPLHVPNMPVITAACVGAWGYMGTFWGQSYLQTVTVPQWSVFPSRELQLFPWPYQQEDRGCSGRGTHTHTLDVSSSVWLQELSSKQWEMGPEEGFRSMWLLPH